jgi:hypothetical protein
MNDPLIMLMSAIIVFHAISRLAHMPSIFHLKWRVRFLSVSIILETAGAFVAFCESYCSISHMYSLMLFMAAICMYPLADKRVAHKHQMKGVAQ